MRKSLFTMALMLATPGVAAAGGVAPLEITFDDRVLFLNGWIDGTFIFDEYFGDAFASPSGQFVSPGFSASVGDGRSGDQQSFVDSFANESSLIEFNADDSVTMTGIGSSGADAFYDSNDSFGVNAFGSSEFDVDFTISGAAMQYSFGGDLSAGGGGRTRAALFAVPSIFGPSAFNFDTANDPSGVYVAGGVLGPGQYRLDIFSTSSVSGLSANTGGSEAADYDFTLTFTPVTGPDADGDFVPDDLDNCTNVANEAQIDADGDGFGNFCDADLNNDCTVDFQDLGAFRAAFSTTPATPNWNPSADLFVDLSVNFLDLGIMKASFFNVPGPAAAPNLCSP